MSDDNKRRHHYADASALATRGAPPLLWIRDIERSRIAAATIGYIYLPRPPRPDGRLSEAEIARLRQLWAVAKPRPYVIVPDLAWLTEAGPVPLEAIPPEWTRLRPYTPVRWPRATRPFSDPSKRRVDPLTTLLRAMAEEPAPMLDGPRDLPEASDPSLIPWIFIRGDDPACELSGILITAFRARPGPLNEVESDCARMIQHRLIRHHRACPLKEISTLWIARTNTRTPPEWRQAAWLRERMKRYATVRVAIERPPAGLH